MKDLFRHPITKEETKELCAARNAFNHAKTATEWSQVSNLKINK